MTAMKVDASLVSTENGVLLSTNFDGGTAEGWSLSPGWYIKENDGNYALYGSQHSFAIPVTNNVWTDYEVSFRFNIEEGGFHFNVRYLDQGPEFRRYYIGIWKTGGGYLSKQVGTSFSTLVSWAGSEFSSWHTVRAKLSGNEIKLYIDDALMASYSDDANPIRMGTISFETLTDDENNAWTSKAYFDDIVVTGSKITQENLWQKLGGPLGGLGYDIRIHPTDKKIMFITDNPSGIQKSTDGGATWQAKNRGVTARGGVSGDGVPNFSLTIDNNKPDIVWAGMQDLKGIFKSVDSGETWQKKDKGIEESSNITFRGFAVKPGDSNIVLAAAEITTGSMGEEFDRAKGKIYRSEDGGETWLGVWSGDSLARVLIFNPQNPDIVYCSTGIFDREAWNASAVWNGTETRGVGVLKSTDGGKTWQQINNGIDDLFVGFLEMHPSNPDVLFAAAGNNVEGYHDRYGGIYRTVDGGGNWQKVLGGDIFSVVVVSPSDPKVVYAGSATAFYRSDNSGETWQKYYKPAEDCWGPPGVRAGFPISALVDPDDPGTIFVNNYGGGAFKSVDGAKTWKDASKGYTGATLRKIAAPSNGYIYTIGRSGPFKSVNNGESWEGLAYAPAAFAEYNTIIANPQNSLEIIASDEHQGAIVKSNDGGKKWQEVFRHPSVDASDPSKRHGFRVIAYAPSDLSIVYAGMSQDRKKIDGDVPVTSSFGMYKSSDSGKTWKAINTGLETTDKNILALAVHPKKPEVLYIGTYQDGIYKSLDGGGSWQSVSNGLGSMDIRSLVIDPENPDIIIAGLGGGAGIYRSIDAGQSWASSNSGMALECPSFLQRAGEVKAGISLSRASSAPDSYSMPWSKVTAIVFDPYTQGRLFAADELLGVFYSEDSGRTWATLNEGLSTKAVSDLALSRDGAFLFAATQGEGLFKLRINEDNVSCAYKVLPAARTFSGKAGAVTVRITAEGYNCESFDLTISDQSWITATKKFSKNRGTIKVSVLSNNSSLARQGSVTAGGKSFEITQAGAPCTYKAVSPSKRAYEAFSAGGGTGSINITTAPADCAWTAVVDNSKYPWITIDSGSSGTGSGTVSYTDSANATKSARTGKISLVGNDGKVKKAFTVKQAK